MSWEVTLEGVEHKVEVEPRGDHWLVTIDGEVFELGLSVPEPDVLLFRRGERSWQADVDPTADGVAVTVRGRRYDVQVVDERARALAALGVGGAATGEQVISTSMPGKVVALLVEAGQTVEAGQGIVVVEAMKMENELKAKAPGVVQSVQVEQGQPVEGGATLVVIVPLPG